MVGPGSSKSLVFKPALFYNICLETWTYNRQLSPILGMVSVWNDNVRSGTNVAVQWKLKKDICQVFVFYASFMPSMGQLSAAMGSANGICHSRQRRRYTNTEKRHRQTTRLQYVLANGSVLSRRTMPFLSILINRQLSLLFLNPVLVWIKYNFSFQCHKIFWFKVNNARFCAAIFINTENSLERFAFKDKLHMWQILSHLLCSDRLHCKKNLSSRVNSKKCFHKFNVTKQITFNFFYLCLYLEAAWKLCWWSYIYAMKNDTFSTNDNFLMKSCLL